MKQVLLIGLGILFGYVLVEIAKYIKTKYNSKHIDFRRVFKITTILLAIAELINAGCLDYRDKVTTDKVLLCAIPVSLALWVYFAYKQGKLKLKMTDTFKSEFKGFFRGLGILWLIGLIFILLAYISQ